MIIFAHRGFSAKAPENTLAAFRLAVETGADGVELDVHLTADNELVVIHDETLTRTVGANVSVHDHTLAQLQAFDAGSAFDRRFAGERLPSLAEVCTLIVPHKTILNVELKTNKYDYPGIEAKLLACLDEHGLIERTIISSFNFKSLGRMRELHATLPLGMLFGKPPEGWARTAAEIRANAIHPSWPHTTPALIAQAHDAGLKVNVWTVNQAAEAMRLAAEGVDGIITDDPASVRTWLETSS